MGQIAWIIGHTYFYWNEVIRLLAVLAAVCVFLALYPKTDRRRVTAALWLPLAVLLSLVFSRVAHWYFRPEGYDGLYSAMTPMYPGDFALMGVFAGCILAGILLRLIMVAEDFPALMDDVCLSGCLGIAVGRLGSVFDTSDRGMLLPETIGFPWGAVVYNPVTGMPEYRLATFLLQSVTAGLLFAVLLAVCLWGRKKDRLKSGEVSLLFFLFYGASQVILDSTRYDALVLRSNGFLRPVQILGAAAMATVVVFYAVRLVQAGGWKKYHPFLWLLQLGCFGTAGYMEYYVQRHGNQALTAYSIMGAALAVLLVLTLLTRCLAAAEERKHTAWLREIQQFQSVEEIQ